MSNKTAKHPTGIEITFSANDHRYTDDRGFTYDSVTRVVSDLFPPFDATGISERKAAREGVNAESLREEWKAKGDAACVFGTRVHETAEDSLLSRAPRHKPNNPRERAAFKLAWDAGQMILSRSASVHPEAIIFDPESLTAGTVDLLATRRDSTGLVLGDWKTCVHIDSENKYGGRALAPFEHLHDCHLVRYGLQLGIYEYILRKCQYVRADESIVKTLAHIAHGADEISWLELPDLRSEVAAIMKLREQDQSRIKVLSERIKQTFAANTELDAEFPKEFLD